MSFFRLHTSDQSKMYIRLVCPRTANFQQFKNYLIKRILVVTEGLYRGRAIRTYVWMREVMGSISN